MGFEYSIVGSPNVGKSTLFNALTKASIEAANFPFYTIEPNAGAVPVPDPRLDRLAEVMKPQRTLPATMEFVDIAGLVKSASKDKGLGNQFLANIRETGAIGHVVRCSENGDIIYVSGEVNPADDIEAINTELTLADLDTYGRAIHRVQKEAKGGDKDVKTELTVLKECLLQPENAGVLCALGLSAEERAAARYLNFLTLKPTMYIANVNEDGFENNPYPDQVREIAAREGSVVVLVCATVEADTAELDDEERDEFIQELELEEPSLNRVIHADYKLPNLQTYFTAGAEKVRAWTTLVSATALQAASKIRTDFEKGLIHVQTISFEDFITYKGGQGAKEAGKMRVEGRGCIVRDGDVMSFLFNV